MITIDNAIDISIKAIFDSNDCVNTLLESELIFSLCTFCVFHGTKPLHHFTK